MYFHSRSFVWGIILSCDGYVGGYRFFYINVNWRHGLGYRLPVLPPAFIPSSHTCMVSPWIHMWPGFPTFHWWWGKMRGATFFFLYCIQCSYNKVVYGDIIYIIRLPLIPGKSNMFLFYINLPPIASMYNLIQIWVCIMGWSRVCNIFLRAYSV